MGAVVRGRVRRTVFRSGGRTCGRTVALVVAGQAVALVAAVFAPQAVAAAPSNPSDGQIAAARQSAHERAAAVGRLGAAVAVKQGEASRFADAAEIAVEDYNRARADLQLATERAARAQAAVGTAQARVDGARQDLVRFARGSYVQGSLLGSSLALLAPGGPRELVQRMDYLQVAGRRRLDVVGRLVRATVARANAGSDARAAVVAQQAATVAANQARAAAVHRVVESRGQVARLRTQITTMRQQLSDARQSLSTLTSQRATYLAWDRRQKAAAAARARQRARALAAQQAAAAAAAQQAAAQQDAGAAPPPNAPAASAQEWTPELGQRVADAALRWLGTPYAWAGGDLYGPTPGEFPDDGVRGFDCSGLALWAWGQVGYRLPHYSGYQYRSGAHVGRSDLMPGDLLFWSYDGTPAGIHHVAIYLGGDRVVQAPESGDVVKVSRVWSTGYLGATRPGG